jgi:hypothetical protein
MFCLVMTQFIEINLNMCLFRSLVDWQEFVRMYSYFMKNALVVSQGHTQCPHMLLRYSLCSTENALLFINCLVSLSLSLAHKGVAPL